MSDQKELNTKGMLTTKSDKTTEDKTEAAAKEKGETVKESKQKQEIDVKGLLEYLQGKFDQQNKKMNEQKREINEQSRILKASIADNANRFKKKLMII